MNNFEFTQKIRDELPNQIRRDIEEVKIAIKKIIKKNSKLGFLQNKDLTDIKDLILKGSISKNKEIALTDESKKVLDFAVNYDAAIMNFAMENPNLNLNRFQIKILKSKKLNFWEKFVKSHEYAYDNGYKVDINPYSGLGSIRRDAGIKNGTFGFFLFLSILLGFFYHPIAGILLFIGYILMSLIHGIKDMFSLRFMDDPVPIKPNNVFENKIAVLEKFLESTRSMAQFEILLNQAQLNNVDLIINAIHITNTEKMQLIESILSHQRACMNHFDMVYLDIEREKLYEKIYEKKLPKNFFSKWIELTKKSWWIGFILGTLSFIGGTALMPAIVGGACCAATFGGIRTLFYYLISNRLLNKNIENRMKASQVVQQYLNQQKENLIRKIQYCC